MSTTLSILPPPLVLTYLSSDAAYEIGELSQNMLKGDFQSKERIRSFYWAAHQLARKMNLMQMAELTQACADLQAVFDLSALIRRTSRPSRRPRAWWR